MSFLVANTALRLRHIDREVNFFNAHHFVPDIHDTRAISYHTLPIGFRCIKSHSGFNPLYLSVVYTIRHPEDVMVSYYKFMCGLGSYNGTISDFIRSQDYGIAAWVRHVQGWLSPGNNPALAIILVRYEDLKADPGSQVYKIFRFFGYYVSVTIREHVTKKTSFSLMKGMEEELYENGRPIAKDFRFMRKGVSLDNTEELSAEDRIFIREIAGFLMKQFNYE